MEIGDKVQLRGGHIGTIVNINEFREPSMKYAVDIESFDDVVFCGDNDIIETIYSATQELELPIKKYIAENYVSKKKIKDKIYYIQSTYSQVNGSYFMMNNAIKVLQELLEEEDE